MTTGNIGTCTIIFLGMHCWLWSQWTYSMVLRFWSRIKPGCGFTSESLECLLWLRLVWRFLLGVRSCFLKGNQLQGKQVKVVDDLKAPWAQNQAQTHCRDADEMIKVENRTIQSLFLKNSRHAFLTNYVSPPNSIFRSSWTLQFIHMPLLLCARWATLLFLF